ncbi:hypothetical protein [Carp edema virus]|nr:hypothetical protein [Carp edema virus]
MSSNIDPSSINLKRRRLSYYEFTKYFNLEELFEHPKLIALTVSYSGLEKNSFVKVFVSLFDHFNGYSLVTQTLLTFKATREKGIPTLLFLGEDVGTGMIYFWKYPKADHDILHKKFMSEKAILTKRQFDISNRICIGRMEFYCSSIPNLHYHENDRIHEYIKPSAKEILYTYRDLNNIRTNIGSELTSIEISFSVGCEVFTQPELMDKLKFMFDVILEHNKNYISSSIKLGYPTHDYSHRERAVEAVYKFYENDDPNSEEPPNVRNKARDLIEFYYDDDEIIEPEITFEFPGILIPKYIGNTFL